MPPRRVTRRNPPITSTQPPPPPQYNPVAIQAAVDAAVSTALAQITTSGTSRSETTIHPLKVMLL